MFRFYLNNTLVEDPVNWGDFSETIERDFDLKILLPRYDISLNFSGNGYKLLYGIYSSSGFCNLVNLRIEYKCTEYANYENILNALIFISDIKFNLSKCSCECPVTDDNFGARIFNNKNIKAKIDVEYSKNGMAITPAAPVSMSVFDISNALLYQRNCYPVFEILRFLIDFMSDGLMGFESNFLTPADPNQTAGWMYLISGKDLRTNNGDVFITSFQEVIQEINKKYQITLTVIKGSDGRPTIKLENDSFFYNTNNALTINAIQDLEMSFNSERLYSSIKFGLPVAEFDPALGHFPVIRFLSFQEEEYQLQGECNIDRKLDLTGVFVADSNIIERITQSDTSNDQYDTSICFIESILGIGTNLTPSPTTGIYPYYYNSNLTNNKVAERYSVANNIAFYLGNNNEAFRASRTAGNYSFAIPAGNYSPALSFDDDSTPPNFDTTGAYTNPKYTAAADGVYSFESNIFCRIVSTGAPANYYIAVVFLVYDSGGVLQQTVFGGAPTLFVISAGTYSFIGNASINMLTGHYAIACLYNSDWPSTASRSYRNTSYFKTTSVQNGGGVYQYKPIADYFINRFEFEAPLSSSAYNILKSDLSQSVKINTDGVSNYNSWIRKVIRKYKTGETKWELISNVNNSN